MRTFEYTRFSDANADADADADAAACMTDMIESDLDVVHRATKLPAEKRMPTKLPITSVPR